jgi:hypothetical protein
MFAFRFRFGIRWRRIVTEMDRSQMAQLTMKKIMVMKPRGENGSDGGGGSQREEESDFYQGCRERKSGFVSNCSG